MPPSSFARAGTSVWWEKGGRKAWAEILRFSCQYELRSASHFSFWNVLCIFCFSHGYDYVIEFSKASRFFECSERQTLWKPEHTATYAMKAPFFCADQILRKLVSKKMGTKAREKRGPPQALPYSVSRKKGAPKKKVKSGSEICRSHTAERWSVSRGRFFKQLGKRNDLMYEKDGIY